MKKQIFAILLSAILLSSCSNQADKVPNANGVTFGANITVSENYAFRVQDELLYLWDLDNNSYNVFCSQPNCKHQTLDQNKESKCTAIAPKIDSDINYTFLYNDKLYKICRGYLNETLVYESQKDGSGEKLCCTLPVVFSEMCFPCLNQGRLAFVGSTTELDEKEKVSIKLSLCLLDFSDFNFENLLDLGALNETFISANSLYLDEQGIYYEISKVKNNIEETTVKYLKIKDKTEKNLINESKNNLCVWQYLDDSMIYNVAYNNETESVVYSYNLKSNEHSKLFEFDGYVYSIYKDNDKIFFLYSLKKGEKEFPGAGVYDAKNNSFNTKDFSEDLFVNMVGNTSDKHLIHYQNSQMDSFGMLSDKDFWNLDFEKADFKFEQSDSRLEQ